MGQQCLRRGVTDPAGGAGDRDGLAGDVVHAAELYTCQVLVEGRVQFLTDDGAVVLMHHTTCGYFESR